MLNDLSYRLFGGHYSDEIFYLVKDVIPSSYDITKVFVFPKVSSLIWVSTIQIRLNIVDQSEDSNVLINIPISDYNQPYISFINPQLEQTAKTLKSQIGTQIEVKLTNQDGYEISLKDVDCNLDILLF